MTGAPRRAIEPPVFDAAIGGAPWTLFAMPALEHLREDLERLRAEGLYRDPSESRVRDSVGDSDSPEKPPSLIDVSSNDYLARARESVSRETFNSYAETVQAFGSGASRLIHGSRHAHDNLERRLADWVRLPTALLFSSGYAANMGVLTALMRPSDVVISDALNHASIVDGCRLSRATIHVVPHLDLREMDRALADASAARCRWVVTETLFSMDGDVPDLSEIRTLCDRHRAGMILDEAHSLGVFGPEGSGLAASAAIQPDVLVGTLGKAVGVQGAFVAGSEVLRSWLWNRARPFVFSTAMSPLLCELIAGRVELVRSDDEARRRLLRHARRLTNALRESGVPVLRDPAGPIVPIVLGKPEIAVRAARYLLERGVLVQAIRPPTVPPGSSRLRLSLSSALTDADLEKLAVLVPEACRAALA